MDALERNPGGEAMTSQGASVVIVGGGVTGLSAAWWLARAGIDVLVIERGVIGWEASGRNGGGCTHAHSPLFSEEQRLWPQMDALLGHPTEWQPYRIGIARNEADFGMLSRRLWRQRERRVPHQRPECGRVARAGAAGRRRRVWRAVFPLRRPRQPAAHRAGLWLGVAAPGRADRAARDRHRLRLAGDKVRAVQTSARRFRLQLRWSSPPARRPAC